MSLLRYFRLLVFVTVMSFCVGVSAQNEGLSALREPPSIGLDTIKPLSGKTDNFVCYSGYVMPPFLNEGDSVAVVAPGFFTPDKEIIVIMSTLRSWGLVPFRAPNVGQQHALRYAGTADQRLYDIEWALSNNSIKAVFCIRGGYGALHLIPHISPAMFRKQPKWIVGYSDITTLHSASVLGGTMSIHGAVGRELGSSKVCNMNYLLLRDLLFGNLPHYQVNRYNRYNKPGRVSGRLVGGNLTTLTTLLSTDFDVTRLDSIILFIEDVDEPYHNIDRMFNMLRIHGVFDRCVGLVMGSFSQCRKDFGCENVYELLSPYFKDLNIPVLCDFPTGHGPYNFPLIEGAPATLDVNETASTLIFNIEGRWQPVGYPWN